MKKEDLRIIFMGTPEFAVSSLHELITCGYRVVGVVTAPDKPAGRGKKVIFSAVKQYAIQHNLQLLQPEKLKDETFISELKSKQANLQIVVAFRMLPEVVWSMPEYGTFNLHASLLPQYRGAAPINHVIINGEKETGLTTFFLDREIDTGAIIKQLKIPIGDEENAEQLHDKMMVAGAGLVIETVNAIINQNVSPLSQSILEKQVDLIKTAPKISKEDCRIDWNKNAVQVVNLVRGLSTYPASFAEFISDEGFVLHLKIYNATAEMKSHSFEKGIMITDKQTFIKIAVADGYVYINELQQAGKRRVDVRSFLRGFRFEGFWRAI